jgi:hypothetical protein
VAIVGRDRRARLSPAVNGVMKRKEKSISFHEIESRFALCIAINKPLYLQVAFDR